MYSDPIIQKIFTAIKAKNGEIKKYYEAFPLRICDSELPAIVISKVRTEVASFDQGGAASRDQQSISLVLTLITSVRSELSTANADSDTVAGVAKLYDLMEGRSESDYTLKTTSLLSILRNNLNLDIENNLRIQLEGSMAIDYGEASRDENGEQWTTEANIAFDCHFVQRRNV